MQLTKSLFTVYSLVTGNVFLGKTFFVGGLWALGPVCSKFRSPALLPPQHLRAGRCRTPGPVLSKLWSPTNIFHLTYTMVAVMINSIDKISINSGWFAYAPKCAYSHLLKVIVTSSCSSNLITLVPFLCSFQFRGHMWHYSGITVHTEVIPCKLRGPYGLPWIKLRSVMCKAKPSCLYYHSSPKHIFVLVIPLLLIIHSFLLSSYN